MRPRERLAALGAGALSPQELVALLLGGGTPGESAVDLAGRLLVECGGLRALARAPHAELRRAPGVGDAKAARIAAAFELGRRAGEDPATRGARLGAARDVWRLLGPTLRDERREVFMVLLLDGRHRLLRAERASVGTLTASLVHPREVFAPAIRERAAAVIVVHNHPSGDPSPSPEDVAVTRRLDEAGRLVGIPLLDHVILGDPGFTSMREAGHLARAGA